MSNFVNDTFAGTAGTNLSAHTPNTGGAYSKEDGNTGDLVLSGSNSCRLNTLNTFCFYLNATAGSTADYTVSASLTQLAALTGNVFPSITARDDNNQTGYRLQYWRGTGAGSNAFYLYKTTAGGGTTQLGSPSNFTASIGTPFTMTLQVSGTTITCSLNGTPIITVTDSAISAIGQVGLGHFADNNADIGNSVGIHFNSFTASQSSGATAYTLTGPTAGPVSLPSADFTVTPVGGSFTGTITLSDGGAGGSFTPSATLTFSSAAAQTVTYTASTVGAKTISGTNSGSLTDPGSLTYTAVATLTHSFVVTGDPNASSSTVGFQVKNLDGTAFQNRTTSGVGNQGQGAYSAAIVIPASYAGVLEWDDNGVIFAFEALVAPAGGALLLNPGLTGGL